MKSWDDTARSHNHYFLDAAGAWMHETVCGLRCTAPGWTACDVAPVADDRIA